MAAIATRGDLAAGGDRDLCPLPATQLTSVRRENLGKGKAEM